MGNLRIVRYLTTEANCDVNTGNSEGWTPLHIACWYPAPHHMHKVFLSAYNNILQERKSGGGAVSTS